MTRETIKPEVGQVWEYKTDDKHKINIIREYTAHPMDGKFRSKEECRGYDCVYILKGKIETAYFLFEELIEYYTYIGKAKGSISDLFKIKRPKNMERMKGGKRWCSRCKTYKDLDCFFKDSRRKDGISNTCRECNRKLVKEGRLRRKLIRSK